jgi:diguanylate cyclase (GGDEF)-like protein/PAS domain S-box-containing protein
VSSIARDITQSTRAAAALRAAQERFRVAFDEAPIGMALVGLDRAFIEVNDALAEIIGYEAADLLGRDMTSLFHPDDPAVDLAAARSCIDGRPACLGTDRRLRHAAGHAVWVTVSIACVRDAGGEPQHFLAQLQDVTDRRGYEAQLQQMADHDPLTGLLNRRAFDRELTGHVSRGERYGAGGAALMLDIDRFKHYNDTLGHPAGDGLITRVAHALSTRLRKSDVLARLGGDEFAVILPDADEAAARQVAGELLACVRTQSVLAPDGSRLDLTASVGVAFFDDEPGVTPERIMASADRAMYEAKKAGGDRAAMHWAGRTIAVGP